MSDDRADVGPPPPDQPERRRIVEELESTMLVEASAGTGKTTSMLARMTALLRAGKCRVDSLVAVTFTRKAAAEIRTRFQVALERAAAAAQGVERQRLEAALQHLPRAYIGTIHGFCARLLRERPLESNVPLSFVESDEQHDELLRRRAWRQFVDSLLADNAPLVEELEQVGLPLSRALRHPLRIVEDLEDVGIELPELGKTFLEMLEYPDIQEWPTSDAPAPDHNDMRARVEEYLRHIDALGLEGVQVGNCKLIPLLLRIKRLARRLDLRRRADLARLLEFFARKAKAVQKQFPGGSKQGKVEQIRYDTFRDEHVLAWLLAWKEHCYGPVLRALRLGVAEYDRLRAETGSLNYQDLLLRARDLVRDFPEVRRDFQRRFTHLLVDEFQDTDPIQAELLMLLVAADPEERDWRLCRPRPGSLFVVGDPKQSIYRFRRADILTYTQVQRMIAAHGSLVRLSTNFRSRPGVIRWVNGAFAGVFGEQATDTQAASRPLDGYLEADPRDGDGIEVLRLPKTGNHEERLAIEAPLVAEQIRRLLAERSDVRPSDILLIATAKAPLARFAEALQRVGVPHVVAAVGDLASCPELVQLWICLRAVTRPHDSLALLAAVRGDLFGVPDQALYVYRRAGGLFQLGWRPARQFGPECDTLLEALTRLDRYARWLRRLPPAIAAERIAEDSGLLARAAAAEDGVARAGTFCQGLRLLRDADVVSGAELERHLRELLVSSPDLDSLPARGVGAEAVRIMNLHKAKGLEADFVYLVNPAPTKEHPIRLHIDRSGAAPRGYLAVYSDTALRHQPRRLLAIPPGWDEWEAKERQFLDDERRRLMYVAATRAGRRLTISVQPERHQWSEFDDDLVNVPELDVASATASVGEPSQAVSECGESAATASAFHTFAEESLERAERWRAAERPSHRVLAAKVFSLPGRPATSIPRQRARVATRDGVAWGSAVHSVLEQLGRSPGVDPRPLAIAALERAELSASDALVDELLRLVDDVRATPLWQRAEASSLRLCETPFTAPLPARLDRFGESTQAILSGVIDLAFREASGWVIVDYKSDRIEEEELEELARHYAPQVQAYAAVWEELTEDPVSERLLLFTHLRRAVVVPPLAEGAT